MSLRRVTLLAHATAVLVTGALLGGGPALAASPTFTPVTGNAVTAPAAELLVAFDRDASRDERAEGHRDSGGTVAARVALAGVDVVDLARGTSPAEALEAYRSNPDVRFAERNVPLSIAGASNDLGAGLWGLDNTGQSGGLADADVDAPEGWGLIAGTSGDPWPVGNYTVGVVDTGIDAAHEDLGGKAVTPCMSALGGGGNLVGGCADDNGHGTHASGTIAATANNGRGIVGVAPGARVLMCKALDAKGSGYLSDIVACMNDIVARRAALNLKVMSLSIGGGGSETLRVAVDNAYNSGVLVVAAAGNRGDSSLTYPAGYASAVSVGATDRRDGQASFSNANADVEISAPGVAIVSTVPGGYASYSGTSMATPHVAGAAALIASRDGRGGAALRAALAAAVDDLGPGGRDPSFGFGRLNVCKALGGGCAYTPFAAGPSAGTATPATATATDRTPPRVRASWPRRLDARTALREGIRAACRANEPATCTLAVELNARDAGRLGLRRARQGGAPVTIASGSAKLARAGSANLVARLTRAAARALAAGKGMEVTLRLAVTDPAGNRAAAAGRATLSHGAGTSRARRVARSQ